MRLWRVVPKMMMVMTGVASIALMPPNAIADTPAKQQPTPAKRKTQNLTPKVVGADDLAVAASVVSILSGLYTFFNHPDDNSAAVLAELGTIEKQNQQIIGLLDQVVAILNNLGEIVGQAVQDTLLNDHRSTLANVFEQFWEHHSAELQGTQADKDAAMAAYPDLYDQLRTVVRVMADEGNYGFAALASVATAMNYEFYLAERLNVPQQTQIEAATFYLGYFTDALDPTKPNSIAQLQQQVNTSVASEQQILNNADHIVATSPTFMIAANQTVTFYPAPQCTEEDGYDVVATVSGNQTDGYSASAPYQVNRHVISRYCDNPHRPSVKPAAVPTDSGDQSAAGRVAYWNAVRTALSVDQPEQPVFAQIIQIATMAQQAARANIASLQSQPAQQIKNLQP